MKRITAIIVAIIAAVAIVTVLRRAAPVEQPAAPPAAVVNNVSETRPARLEDYASMSRDEIIDRLQAQKRQLAQKQELLKRSEEDFEVVEEPRSRVLRRRQLSRPNRCPGRISTCGSPNTPRPSNWPLRMVKVTPS